jgi:tetratricopeptide (TPR) repeat protein
LITEYVEGQTIDSYCDDRKLDIPARLRIFLQVCDAVVHAHGNLILHRDLKPGNILVDTSGAAKLLDFGTGQLVTPDQATLTRNRMLTPRYASPEQLRGQRVGVATDIFSLGVVLYELVTGAWPFGNPDSTLSELSRAMGDVHVRSPASVPAPEAAIHRSVSLERLRHQLRGDLSAILLKALEDDPARRYESVGQMAGDLRNYLERRPVLARPQTLWYRAGKFSRRHRVGIAAGAALLLFVTASSALLYQVRLRGQEKAKQVAGLQQIVTQAIGMIQDDMTRSQLERAREEALRLRESLEQVGRDNPENPIVCDLLGRAYLQLGQLAWFRYGPSLMDAGLALDSYARARTSFEAADRRHASPGEYDMVMSARLFQSELLVEDGHGFDAFAEAAQLLRDGEASLPEPAKSSFGEAATVASDYDMLSDRLGANMKWPERPAPGWYAALAALQPYRMTDSIARALYEAALPARAGEDAQTVASSRSTVKLQLGRLQHEAGLREQGRRTLQEALQAYSEAASKAHGGYVQDHIAGVHIQISGILEAEGKIEESLREREQALEVLEKEFSQDPQSIYLKERLGASRIASARLLARLGRRAEALRDGRLGLGYLAENAGGPRAAALTLDSIAQRLLTVEPAELRDPAGAREYARRAVAQTASQMPPYLVTLAFAELASGREEEGRHAAARAVEGYRRVAEILAPLFDSSKYAEAARLYSEWRGQLAKLSSLR